MPIPLSSIKGLMINKEPSQATAGFHEPPSISAHNRAIDQQSAKKIGMNREKLAKIIYTRARERFFTTMHPINAYPDWNNANDRWKKYSYDEADAIIADEADIIEAQS